ncbi:MAG: hypothetical protein EHM58_16165 [Ignavibacteriae bacterium]|nr:MAG: hypothetical protein EHM58_16165 [Ignavibacteriota bacterium]
MNINKQITKLPFIVHIYYLMAAGSFTYLYYQLIIKTHYFLPFCSVPEVYNGTALKVYQYRVLVPYIIKPLTLFGLLPEITVFTIYTWFVIYLTFVIYRLFLREYFRPDWVSMFLAPFLGYAMLWNYILNNTYYCQFYDFTAILFFVLGSYLIIKEKFYYLLITFVFAVLNKETAVLLIFAFIFYNYKNIFSKKIILRVIALSSAFIIIKAALYFIYIDSPGNFVYDKIGINIQTIYDVVRLRNIIYLKDIITSFGGLYIFVIILLFSKKWKVLTQSMNPGKLYLNLTFIPYILIGFSFICIEECRVYTEIVPLFTTLFIIYLSTFKSLGIEPVTKEISKKPLTRKILEDRVEHMYN